MLQNNFTHPEFSFIKSQGFTLSSVSFPPLAFSSFLYNVIISRNRKTEREKFSAETERLLKNRTYKLENFSIKVLGRVPGP